MTQNKIIAVVVTYNRLELLKKTISRLKDEAMLSGIIVVNNSSTDGTDQWLAEQEGLEVITQPNVGGSGGFSRGMQHAMDLGAELIWCMDDDVFPSAGCLAAMTQYATDGVGIVAPRRMMDGRIYTTEFRSYDFTNPLASTYIGKLSKETVTEATDIQGAAFEGLLISRCLVDAIGYPNKDFFIFYDDTDYCLRAVLGGFRIIYVPEAILEKHRFFADDSWGERNRKKRWKRFYQVRNGAYLNHHYGKNVGVRYLRSFINVVGYMGVVLYGAVRGGAYRLSDVARFWKAYRNGIRENLGIGV